MKCSQCRHDIAEQDSPWERVRYWLAWHLFPTDMADEKAGAYTQGFSDGYIQGKQEGIERFNVVLKNIHGRTEKLG